MLCARPEVMLFDGYVSFDHHYMGQECTVYVAFAQEPAEEGRNKATRCRFNEDRFVVRMPRVTGLEWAEVDVRAL